MKLTESRIKEIIKEEMLAMTEQDKVDSNVNQEDETKTLAALKKFMLEKTKQVSQLKGASALEVTQIAEMVDLMFGLVGKGEISRFLQYGKEQVQKKAGIK
jgi:predicted transposase YdaD